MTEYYRETEEGTGGASERNEKVPVVGCCLLLVVCCLLFVVVCWLFLLPKRCLSQNYSFIYETRQVTLYEKQREWEAP